MRIIYPADLINGKMVDEHFAMEASAASETVALHREGSFIPRGIANGEEFLYRGWILSKDEYQDLEAQVNTKGGSMIVSADEYANTQFGTNWFNVASGFTPDTVILSINASDSEIMEAANSLNAMSFVIKGANKSVGIWEKMYARTVNEVIDRVNDLRDYSINEEHIMIRAFEEWTNQEVRTWWVDGEFVYGHEHTKENFGISSASNNDDFDNFIQLIREVVENINSPLVTVDVVRAVNGEWRIVEIGNGQVSEPKGKTFGDIISGTSLSALYQ